MAQFETPQFIERQAKVIGPLTFRGAAYVGVPIILIFLIWFTIADNYSFYWRFSAFARRWRRARFRKTGRKNHSRSFTKRDILFYALSNIYLEKRKHKCYV
jgi:hypothetical protein